MEIADEGGEFQGVEGLMFDLVGRGEVGVVKSFRKLHFVASRMGRHHAGFSGGSDGRDRHAVIESGLGSPFAGAFLFAGVFDQIDEVFTGFFVFFGKNCGSDFYEERVEISSLVPIVENLVELVVAELAEAMEDVVGFR